MSSPRRGRDLPCRAVGETDAGGRWLRARLERSGVLLLRRLGPGEPRGVVTMFGHNCASITYLIRHYAAGGQ
jgi:hypothetical protein